MALINCPECGKEISDKAISCPHCGFPFSGQKFNLDKPPSDKYTFELVNTEINKIKAIKLVQEVTGYGLKESKDLVDNVPSNICTELSLEEAESLMKKFDVLRVKTRILDSNLSVVAESKETVTTNMPKCPTCGSTNISKISGISKATSVAMWGLFSRKVHKQWHCWNCDSEW